MPLPAEKFEISSYDEQKIGLARQLFKRTMKKERPTLEYETHWPESRMREIRQAVDI
jgi:hypothetical protein